jgi:hypothetical protein
MSTETLTSLAMLKVHVDQGQDYLDYLRPFILQVLVTYKPDPVTDDIVRGHICAEFGLEIPERAIQIVLKRLSRQYPLKKGFGVYQITGELPDPRIGAEKADAVRHINAVIADLRKFSQSTAKPIANDEEAVTAICTFLAQFNILFLRAYLRGTAIPTIEHHQDTHIVLVSKYVISLQINPERLESFLVVVKGHMLANALLCPDLHDTPKTYKGVTFYLDTPLLVRQLGLEGEPKLMAISGLVELLLNLGATVAAFSHSRDELERVISGAAQHIESPSGWGAIVIEGRRRGTTKSDMLMLAGQIDDKLKEAKIRVISTPRYNADFQIDETAFESSLDDEVSYHNPRAKEDDINSVRSIYALRFGTMSRTIERSKAVLVTSNTGFSRAAYQYGQRHEESREVSTVITDFSLANMAWLKAPLGAPALPMIETLAFSYAALQPSKVLFDRYLIEIDKLESQGKISAKDHQLLRSSQLAQSELMNLTLGEDGALTEQTVTEMLSRVTGEIKKEENEKYRAEKVAHEETQRKFAEQIGQNKRIKERLYWRCQHQASMCAWGVSAIIVILIVGGLAAGVGLQSTNLTIAWILTLSSGLLFFLTLGNLIFGTTVKRLHEAVRTHISTWLIQRSAVDLGLDVTET